MTSNQRRRICRIHPAGSPLRRATRDTKHCGNLMWSKYQVTMATVGRFASGDKIESGCQRACKYPWNGRLSQGLVTGVCVGFWVMEMAAIGQSGSMLPALTHFRNPSRTAWCKLRRPARTVWNDSCIRATSSLHASSTSVTITSKW